MTATNSFSLETCLGASCTHCCPACATTLEKFKVVPESLSSFGTAAISDTRTDEGSAPGDPTDAKWVCRPFRFKPVQVTFD
ncbi:hypothetical protein QFZ23_002375 [Arthrobacter globiformis]|nr:hypothetical protein [Arthrobacter globiformis]